MSRHRNGLNDFSEPNLVRTKTALSAKSLCFSIHSLMNGISGKSRLRADLKGLDDFVLDFWTTQV